MTILGGGLAVDELMRYRPRPSLLALELGLATIGLLVVVVGARLPNPVAPALQSPPSRPGGSG